MVSEKHIPYIFCICSSVSEGIGVSDSVPLICSSRATPDSGAQCRSWSSPSTACSVCWSCNYACYAVELQKKQRGSYLTQHLNWIVISTGVLWTHAIKNHNHKSWCRLVSRRVPLQMSGRVFREYVCVLCKTALELSATTSFQTDEKATIHLLGIMHEYALQVQRRGNSIV